MEKKNNCLNSLEKMIKEQMIPGAAVAFVSQDEVETQCLGNYGYEEPFNELAITQESIYDLASLTKLVGTTTRLLQLLEEGRLTLETEVCSLLPQFPKAKMTIKDLMTHRSGLPADFSEREKVSWTYIASYVQNFEYRGPQPMVYSDIGYILLGYIIEQLDGMNLERSFYEYIFKENDLAAITYFPVNPYLVVPTEQKKNGDDFWQGQVHDEKGRMLERPIGSAGLFATLDNLVQFARRTFVVPEGKKSIFSTETLELLKQTESDGRSLGWAWFPVDDNKKLLYHTGFTGTSIGIDLEKKEALIILTNRVHPTRGDRGYLAGRETIYRTYFGL